MRPIIGIPCFGAKRARTLRPIYGNNQAYVREVERAGGVPLLIPPLNDDDALRAVCARLDGVLLTGGEDVCPELYGEEPIPACGQGDRERDEQELAFARWALDAGAPLLGICRGMQLLNVALGGTLYQDLPSQNPEAADHLRISRPRSYRAHGIDVSPNGRLAAIIGAGSHSVNSLHHQAVARVGEGAHIVAWSPDDIAEAMELPGHPFALAVQYHPEELAPTDEASRLLFAAFVRACGEHIGATNGASARVVATGHGEPVMALRNSRADTSSTRSASMAGAPRC